MFLLIKPQFWKRVVRSAGIRATNWLIQSISLSTPPNPIPTFKPTTSSSQQRLPAADSLLKSTVMMF